MSVERVDGFECLGAGVTLEVPGLCVLVLVVGLQGLLGMERCSTHITHKVTLREMVVYMPLERQMFQRCV